jgi:hypothetical protein
MKGDFSRSTFRADNRYSQVRAQQGRGVLDADLNEQADITDHVTRTASTDVIGPSGAPFHPVNTFRNFQIAIDQNGADLVVAPGRIYVNGLLCENDGEGTKFLSQPDLPGAALPAAAGSYAVYLDVWERHLTAAEQRPDAFPQMREAALGGADTASRVRVVWQVRLGSIPSKECGAFTPPAPPTGRLRASEAVAASSGNDCLVASGSGYRRLENQLYRVEIAAVTTAKATYKWSRDNGSTVSRVKTSDQNASTIVVEDAGRDDIIGFASARFVELSDESRALNGQAGALFEVDTVTGTSIRVKNPGNLSLALGPHPTLRRWDGSADLAPNTAVELEDGVQIEFDGGTFAVGDYWLIPARTLTGKVEWQRATDGASIFETRHGTRHHFATLAVVSFTGTAFDPGVQDCRKIFPPLTAITARDVSYDPANCSNLQGAATIQQAIDKLCQTSGGEEPGIRIKGISLVSGETLLNDTLHLAAELAGGIRIDCDQRLFDGSVVNKNGRPNPVCTVSVEIPWPLQGEDRQFWSVEAGTIVGYQPIVLAAEVVVQENTIVWTPLASTQRWLIGRLLQMFTEMTNEPDPRVLVRMTLAGNYIWGPERSPRLYLDGEGFGAPADGRVDVRLPSGNGRRGGDFAMWFWLNRQARRVPGIGFFPGRGSRFFAVAPGAATSLGKEAIQLGLDRSAELRALLPGGYELDPQRFNPGEAAALARRSGVGGVTGLVAESVGRLGVFLRERLPNVLRLQFNVEVVPDAQLFERVRAAMSTGAPPDFVLGSEEIGPGLQRLQYTTDFIRL